MNTLPSIEDDSERQRAFKTIADTWSANDSSALANYAAALSDGSNRNYALEKAVDNWSLQDPAGLAAWLNTSPPGVDYDQAIARMISKTDGANRSPDVAMGWVENMKDSSLKFDSLIRVAGEWNQTDSAAAQQYIARVAWITEQQRQDILKNLQTPPSVAVGGADE